MYILFEHILSVHDRGAGEPSNFQVEKHPFLRNVEETLGTAGWEARIGVFYLIKRKSTDPSAGRRVCVSWESQVTNLPYMWTN